MCAGMASGKPSTIGWPILRDISTAFMKHSESMAGNGMILAKNNKVSIESGECGGVGLGILHHLMSEEDEKSIEFRKKLGLDSSSNILLINTEGATDPINYEKVIRNPMESATFEYHMNDLRTHKPGFQIEYEVKESN